MVQMNERTHAHNTHKQAMELAELWGDGGGEDPGPLGSRIAVHAEMLDYAHVDKCGDVAELRAILAALRKGTHGRFPEVSVCERETQRDESIRRRWCPLVPPGQP